MRKIEAYIEYWPGTAITDRVDGVGDETELERVTLIQRRAPEWKIDVSELMEGEEVGIRSFHVNMDENTQSRFEASDVSVRLSLLPSQPERRTRPPERGHFWSKLPSSQSDIWFRLCRLIDGPWAATAGAQLVFGYFNRELNFSWAGIIQKDSIQIDETEGTVDFTAYSALKMLENIPVSWVTQRVVFGDAEPFTTFRRWYLGLALTDAIRLLAREAATCTDYRRWIADPYIEIDPGYVADFAGFVLSLYPYDPAFRSENPFIRNLTYAGGDELYFDLTSDDLVVDIARPGAGGYVLSTTEKTLADGAIAGPASKFSNWERHTPLSYEPRDIDDIPMPGNRATGHPFFGKPFAVKADIMGGSYAYTVDGPTLEIWRYEWRGYTTGVYASGKSPSWDPGIYLGNAASVSYTAHIVAEATSIRWPFLYIAADNELFLFDTVLHTTTSVTDVDPEHRFSGLFYFVNTDRLLAVEEQTGEFVRVHVINASDQSTLGFRSGDIPTGLTMDGYELSWHDIDYSSMFEIAYYRDVSAESETAFVGLTATGPTRIFILSEDLSECLYWANIEDMVGVPLGGKAEITRRYRTETATITMPDGSAFERTFAYNEVWGYIGGGHTYDTAIFSLNLATSGEVRVLNLEGLSLAQAWAELAKFAGAAMFETHTVTDRGEGNVKITPRLNIISRSYLKNRAAHWFLDYTFTDWQRNALYSQYFTRLEIGFSGGETALGIDAGPLGETKEIRELDSGKVDFKFIFDLHFARARGQGILKYHARPRQKWTVTVPIETPSRGGRIFELNDIIHLRYSATRASERLQETARIIAVDYDFSGRNAKITAITEDANAPEPPVTNPLGSTPAVIGQATTSEA